MPLPIDIMGVHGAQTSEFQGSYTQGNMETAMCLWEAMLDIRGEQSFASPDIDKVDAWVSAYFDKYGTVEARHWTIARVPACEAAWERDRQAGTEHEPYDWEHCPLWLHAHIAGLVDQGIEP